MRHTIDHRATSGEAICPYCGVGCRLWADIAYGQVLRIKGAADAPANYGRLCAKGVTVGQTLRAADRATRPLVRRDKRRDLEAVSWPEALRETAARLKKILAEHGPEAIAFYGSGQLDSLAVYCVTKLFKGSLGCNNTDSNSRLCMASSVAAYRSSLGGDGPPSCYDDIEAADTILVAGANMAEAHPVTFDRIKAARKEDPAVKLIVIDPRRTLTADQADLHLPVRAGADIMLFNALARLLWEQEAADEEFLREHVGGWEEFRAALMNVDVERNAAACGLEVADLRRAAELMGRRRLLSFYCMGLGQSTVGMWKINSLINLHLLTGTIGKPGCGPFSLTGQPNAMGGREIGLLSHQLPGYRLVERAADRAQVEAHWRRPPGSISSQPGLTAVEMFRALERGSLKAIWIAATNPLVSLPDLHQVRRAFQKAELVIVQDPYFPTEAAQCADIFFPVASWGEREAISTDSQRMVSHSEKLVDPSGEARPDWEIVRDVAREIGCRGFDFPSASSVWDEWIGLTAGRACDMAGMPYSRLREEKNLQWPCPDGGGPGQKRLYVDHRFAHDDGRARLLFRPHRSPKEETDHEFPLVLTTGRLYSHWHTMTRTGKVRQLMEREPRPFAAIHPELARRLEAGDEELLQISSRRGSISLPALITDRVPPEMVFVPIHWGDLLAPGNAANYLTISALGRVAKQPELKFCAVTVEKRSSGRRPSAAIDSPLAAASDFSSLPVARREEFHESGETP